MLGIVNEEKSHRILKKCTFGLKMAHTGCRFPMLNW